jgi:hypothetical protein
MNAGKETDQSGITVATVAIPALTLAALFTFGITQFLLTYSDFYGDDFLGFYRVRTEPFWQALLVPIGSQIAPFHRLINAAQLLAAPMNYEVATFILLLFHALGVVYLYRTLQLLRHTRLNWFLVAWYCACPYLWAPLAWWSAGLQRFPFVALSLIATYYYLRHAREPKLRHLLFVVLAYFGALGFYAKVILVPLCLVAFDVIHALFTPGKMRLRPGVSARWATCAALVVSGVLYVVLSQGGVSGSFESGLGNLSLGFQIDFQLKSFAALAHGLVGFSFPYGAKPPGVLVYGAVLLLIGYTVYRVPRTVWIWSFLVGILMLNFAIVGMSIRTRLFGVTVALEPRYHYDQAFVCVVFIGIALHQLTINADRIPEISWLRRFRATSLVSALLLSVYCAASYYTSCQAFFQRASDMPKAREYLENLRAGLEPLENERPVFAEGSIPPIVTGMDFIFRQHSQLLRVFGVAATIAPPEQAQYKIDGSGQVVPLRSP